MPTQHQKRFIVLHHTLTARDTTTFEAVNNYHRQQWNFQSSLGYYIGYHYFITGDGVVKQGRADWEAGAHTYQENKNYDSIGICLTGNFDNELPSTAQLKSLRELIEDLMAKHAVPRENLKFHRDYAHYKSCPGTKIGADFFASLLAPTTSNTTDDMMKLVQKRGDREIYAIDKNNRRHAILNWDTFQRGLAMGLWASDILTVEALESYPAGNVVILTADN